MARLLGKYWCTSWSVFLLIKGCIFLQDAKIRDLESNLDSMKYELDRTKQEKEEVMNHYDQVSIVSTVVTSYCCCSVTFIEWSNALLLMLGMTTQPLYLLPSDYRLARVWIWTLKAKTFSVNLSLKAYLTSLKLTGLLRIVSTWYAYASREPPCLPGFFCFSGACSLCAHITFLKPLTLLSLSLPLEGGLNLAFSNVV